MNQLAQHRLNDMVFVKYNRTLQRRMKRSDSTDPILLEEIDEINEWLMGKMEGNSDNNDQDDHVFNNDDLTWSVVKQQELRNLPMLLEEQKAHQKLIRGK